MKTLVTFGVLIAVLGIASMTAGQGGASTTVERGSARLTIPTIYIIERRLGGAEHVKGLDSDEGTVLLRISEPEIQAVLPPGSPEFSDLIVSLRLLTPQEALDVEQHNADLAMQIRDRSGGFSEAIIEKDRNHGWYRLYQTPRIRFLSYALAHPDADTADDVIALCTKSPGARESCRLPTFVVHGVGVETSLPPEGLKYRDKITGHLAALIVQWQKAGATSRP